MPPPATTPTRALSITDTLRDRIFNGDIAPGSHLMEVALAEELGVSRTPVRDAMGRLADEGLLVYQPNRGFLVRQFGIKDVVDAFTLRASLEGLCCRTLGERGLQADALQRLTSMLDEQRAVVYGDEWTEERALLWHDLNFDFHCDLLELADNPWLTDAVRRSRRLPLIFDSESRPHSLQTMRLLYLQQNSRHAFEDHARIVDALERREVQRAESLMQEHVLLNRDILVKALRSAGSNEETSEVASTNSEKVSSEILVTERRKSKAKQPS